MLTIKEVATKLRVTPLTIQRWIRSGKLTASKPGRKWLIADSEISRLLQDS